MASLSSFGNLSLDDRKIIVGVDFGTTFSGLAWAEGRTVIFLWLNLFFLQLSTELAAEGTN